MNNQTKHPKHIWLQEYFEDTEILLQKLLTKDIHCIVCHKRSGMMIGAYISFKTNWPVFTTSELHLIPEKFTEIVLLDDKVYSGKSMRQWQSKLLLMSKSVTTAALYIQHDYHTDVFARDLTCQHTMFYDIKN